MLRILYYRPDMPKSAYSIKVKYSFEDRLSKSRELKSKYPDRIPIILERSRSSPIPDAIKSRFMILKDLTVGQLILMIRRDIKIDQHKAIFIYVNNEHIPHTSNTIDDIYKRYSDDDGFLYITYCAEDVFG